MHTVKDTLKRTFVYNKIADHLQAKIASGELSPGSFLLSERKLADMYNVNHATARKATQVLVDKGLVTKIQGQGILVNCCQQKRRSTKLIGFILCKRKKATPFYFELITCVEKELQKHGFHLIFSSYDDNTGSEIPKMLQGAAVDGVIITGEVPQKLLKYLHRNYINHVLIAHTNKFDCKSNAVSSDDSDIGYQAAKYLLQKHKRIALIRGSGNFRSHDMSREQGFLRAFEERGRQFNAEMLVECESFDPAEIRSATSSLLKRNRPDAVFATNIKFADEAAAVCLESGIKIPEEIEFAFYSSTNEINIAKPVVVRTNKKAISHATVNRLLDMINGKAVGTSINLIPALIENNR